MSSIRIEEPTFYNIEDAVPDTPELAQYDLIEFFLYEDVLRGDDVFT